MEGERKAGEMGDEGRQREVSVATVTVLLLLTVSFDVAVFTVYLVLMNVNNLFTLIHSLLFQLDVI